MVIGKYTVQTFSGEIFPGSWGGGGFGGFVGGSFHEESFHGGRDIAMKGTPDFPALFKKRSELNIKKQVFQLQQQQHQYLKRTEIITYMIGFAP